MEAKDDMMNLEVSPGDVVYALAASPEFATDGICFAGRTSGLYRSEDGGVSWEFAFASLDLQAQLPTSSIAISPTFAADGRVYAGAEGGVLLSSDSGSQWGVVMMQTPPPLVLSLAVTQEHSTDGIILAGTAQDGVLRSSDRGLSWASWNFGLLDLNVIALVLSPDFARDETIFVGVESGIFRSSNGGRSWREAPFPMELAPVLALAISPNYAEDRTLLAGTEAEGLYLSRDDGETWQKIGEDELDAVINAVLVSPDFPNNPDILVLNGDGLALSRDGGASWHDMSEELPEEFQTTSICAPLGLGAGAPLLAGLEDGRVLRLTLPG